MAAHLPIPASMFIVCVGRSKAPSVLYWLYYDVHDIGTEGGYLGRGQTSLTGTDCIMCMHTCRYMYIYMYMALLKLCSKINLKEAKFPKNFMRWMAPDPLHLRASLKHG